MADHTPRFGFTVLNRAEDRVDVNDYKMVDGDRVLLDRLLTHVVERHRHNGTTTSPALPGPPAVEQISTGGTLPPNRDVFYRTALVDNLGQEQVASAIATIHTRTPLTSPTPPTIAPTTGTLMPGEYLYALTFWTEVNNHETLASRPVPGGLSAFGGWELTIPPIPPTATGWNLYRKAPTDNEVIYLISGSTPTWADNGANAPNPLRSLPTANTTLSATSVQIDRPEGVAGDYTCKVFRTFDVTNWSNSLLVWTQDLPIIDTGHAVQHGTPLAASAAVNGAPKINLGTETIGALPPGLLTSTTAIQFTFEGAVTVHDGVWQWVNEFATAIVVSMRACLSRYSAPALQPVRVALQVRRAGSVSWEFFVMPITSDMIEAWVPTGNSLGDVSSFAGGSVPTNRLDRGDALRVVVLQGGEGDIPTDRDLAVSVKLAVRHGSAAQSYEWETP